MYVVTVKALFLFIAGQKNSLIKEESGISNIPCQVCNAPSSGFHFGALTCEGCKVCRYRGVKLWHRTRNNGTCIQHTVSLYGTL